MAVLYRCFWLSNTICNYRWDCKTSFYHCLHSFALSIIYIFIVYKSFFLPEYTKTSWIKLRSIFCCFRCCVFMVAFHLIYEQLIRFFPLSLLSFLTDIYLLKTISTFVHITFLIFLTLTNIFSVCKLEIMGSLNKYLGWSFR